MSRQQQAACAAPVAAAAPRGWPPHGRPPHGRPPHGFSLLELLVVLFVVVLITSLATLNVGSGNQDLRLEAQVREIRNIALFAFDEAQMSGRDMGLLLFLNARGPETTFGYAWRERRPEGWRVPLAAGDVFTEQALPAEVDLALMLEGVPEADLPLAPLAADAAPQVIFHASGEVVPGELELRRRDNGEVLWRLQWDLLGRMTLLPRGEVADDFDRS